MRRVGLDGGLQPRTDHREKPAMTDDTVEFTDDDIAALLAMLAREANDA